MIVEKLEHETRSDIYNNNRKINLSGDMLPTTSFHHIFQNEETTFQHSTVTPGSRANSTQNKFKFDLNWLKRRTSS